MHSSDPFLAWLVTGRRVAPGVLDTSVLLRLAGRFQRCAVRSSLLDRLLQRLAISEDARGGALIWRMSRQDAGATEDSLRSAPGHFVSRTAGPLVSRASTLPASATSSEAPIVRATATSDAHLSVPQSSTRAPAALSNGAVKAGVSDPLQLVSRRVESERSLADFGLAASRVEGRHDGTSTAVEINGKRSDTSSATAGVSGETGTAPAVLARAVSARSAAVFARESEGIVLRKHVIPSDEPSAQQTTASVMRAGPSSPTHADSGEADRVDLTLASNRRPPVVNRVATHEAFETPFTPAARAHQIESTLASTVESRPDARAQRAMVLRKPTVNSAPIPRMTHSAEQVFPSAPSDSRSIQTGAVAPSQRDRKVEAAIGRDHVDLLMERLVTDLEFEARRRGHFRWR